MFDVDYVGMPIVFSPVFSFLTLVALVYFKVFACKRFISIALITRNDDLMACTSYARWVLLVVQDMHDSRFMRFASRGVRAPS